jgi:hypothetical protein
VHSNIKKLGEIGRYSSITFFYLLEGNQLSAKFQANTLKQSKPRGTTPNEKFQSSNNKT